jgi:outer membrane protein OmpA-like peptidoglycan-associated protein
MMMQLRGALLAASIIALPMVASAQPVTGLYVGAGVGVNLLQGENVDSVSSPFYFDSTSNPGVKIGSKVGPAGVLSVGWGLGNGLRFELEGDYRNNAFDSATLSGLAASELGLGSTPVDGREQKFGAMVNVLYDFVGLTPVVQPYVGLGVGYQGANLHGVSAYDSFGDVLNLKNSTEGSFAYQAILGLALPINAAPGLAITAEYRFMGLAGSRSYSGTLTAGGGGPTEPASIKLDQDYNHTFLIGIRYNFGQTAMAATTTAAAAPAPAPAVQPARSYLVFFDWDKATLTDRARQIIKEAADNSTHVQYTRIEVNGYTDTSGTPQYNMGLSIRRASAVKAELVRDGVPVAAIATQGFGETHLLVPTGAGVREPQNRRVEIVIR